MPNKVNMLIVLHQILFMKGLFKLKIIAFCQDMLQWLTQYIPESSLCINNWNTSVIFAKYIFQRKDHQDSKLYRLWEKTKLKKLNHCIKEGQIPFVTICLHIVKIINADTAGIVNKSRATSDSIWRQPGAIVWTKLHSARTIWYFSNWIENNRSGESFLHYCTIFLFSLDVGNTDDRRRSPSINEKDHLVA